MTFTTALSFQIVVGKNSPNGARLGGLKFIKIATMRYVNKLNAWFSEKPIRFPLVILVTAIIWILLMGDD